MPGIEEDLNGGRVNRLFDTPVERRRIMVGEVTTFLALLENEPGAAAWALTSACQATRKRFSRRENPVAQPAKRNLQAGSCLVGCGLLQ